MVTVPTIGFNCEHIKFGSLSFIGWDIGGQNRIRKLWHNYYENADAVVVIDPVSTGAVLAYEIVTKRRMQVVCVWSDVVPEELKSFVAKGMEVEFAGRVQVCAPPACRRPFALLGLRGARMP